MFYINLMPLSRRKYADVTGREQLGHLTGTLPRVGKTKARKVNISYQN